MSFKSVSFDSTKSVFVKTLKKRVDSYFKENKISKHANFNMFLKTILLILLYFGSYSLLYIFNASYFSIVLWFAMGFGMAGIGMSVMRDANNGDYSKNKKINNVFGIFITLLGGNYINWRIQQKELNQT